MFDEYFDFLDCLLDCLEVDFTDLSKPKYNLYSTLHLDYIFVFPFVYLFVRFYYLFFL